MNTLKKQIVEKLDNLIESQQYNNFAKSLIADQILDLFSQSQAERVKAIEGLKLVDIAHDEFPQKAMEQIQRIKPTNNTDFNGGLFQGYNQALSQVLSILAENKKKTLTI